MKIEEQDKINAYIAFMSTAIQAYIREGYKNDNDVIEMASVIAVKGVQQMNRDFS